jgi:hypothetical protein
MISAYNIEKVQQTLNGNDEDEVIRALMFREQRIC